MKAIRITHWVVTVLLSALLLFSASMYVFNPEEISKHFVALGFPTWLMYPMATAKFLGVIMILTKFKGWLTEWAYAGIFFNVLLATGAHLVAGDGEAGVALIATVVVLISYATWKFGWRD